MPLDPQVKALVDFLAQGGGPSISDMTPEEARAAFKQLGRLGQVPPQPMEVSDITIPGPAGQLSARVYKPSGDPPYPTMVFFHGGGWVIGDLETHDATCRALADASGSLVVSVDYRLAPEHKFPAAVDDAYAAVQWVAKHAAEIGADTDRLGIGGDSAGGNLAAVAALLARDRGGPAFAYQLLIYPTVDLDGDFPSKDENAVGYFLTRDDMLWFMNHYIRDDSDKVNPLASPLRAPDHRRLPPAIIVTAEFDPLRDEGEAYAEKLRRAGVQVKLRRYDGMIHGFLSMFDFIARGREAVRDVGSDIRDRVKEKTAAGS